VAENLGPTTRNADLAREILTRAEQEVRELLSQGLAPAEQSARSRAIVARAQREVSDVLAQGQDVAEDVVVQASTEPVAFQFANLRAHALPSDQGELRYRVSGQLTLATMLAFQQAVSRLPGVSSARVAAEPDDVALLHMTTSDPTGVQELLVAMPGVKLELDLA
jgi:hypothetical protein